VKGPLAQALVGERRTRQQRDEAEKEKKRREQDDRETRKLQESYGENPDLGDLRNKEPSDEDSEKRIEWL
jgi:hypothetical protein